jgi:DNA-binding CsgD family transcriptional regulator
MIAGMPGRLVSPVIVGRRAELERAAKALEAAAAGDPTHLLVAGEAGVGKTRFVGELARRAEERGMRVLRGGCAGIGDGLPYGAIVEILGNLVRDLDEPTLRSVVGPSGPDLARLVPAFDPAAAIAPVQREWLQARLLDALLGTFRRLAARVPVLLIVEDIHWSDPATRDVLAYLVRNTRPDSLMLAMTLRSDELHRRHPVLPWLAELERTGRVERTDLERLDVDDTAGLLEAILGAPPEPGLVERIHRRSDGNPFFIEELLAAEEGADTSQVPTTLQGILLARLAGVPEAAQGILGIVAVAGHRIDHDLLAEVAALDEASLLDGIRAAVGSRILVPEADDGREGYAFRHALLAEVAYDELLPGERRHLHRACAEALERRSDAAGSSAAARWAELAHHWSRAHEDERAFAAWLRTAEAAEAAFAFEAALRDYEHALELWPGVADAERIAGSDRAEILGRAAHGAYLAGLPHRAVALQREAVAAVDPALAPLRAGVLQGKLGRLFWMSGDAARALTASQAALALIPDEPPTAERAQVLSWYGQLMMLLDRWEESQALCEEAIEIAVRTGARQVEGHARSTLGLDLNARGRAAEGAASMRTAIEIANEVGNVDDIGRGHVNLVAGLAYAGELDVAAEAAEAGMRAAERVGIASTYGAFVGHNLVQVEYERGDWDRAATIALELDIAQARPPASRYGITRWVPLVIGRGEFVEARLQLERLREQLEGFPVEGQFHGGYQVARAELALWEGRPDEALQAVEAGLAQLAHTAWSYYHPRLYRIGARAAADLAENARARRDAPAERDALERAAPLRVAREAWLERALAVQSGNQADETRAEAATAIAEDRRQVGEPDVAAWSAAVERWRARRRPYLLAYARWREAEALLASGDRAAATAALREAAVIAADLGARPLAGEIASLAQRARLDIAAEAPSPAAPTPAVATPADPYGLTKREREVLGLVALGRTNRQIADALFISENTAGVHVSNILGKLGVAGRTEAAAIAVRAGYAAPTD